MPKSPRTNAESHFKQAMKEKEKARQKELEHVAGLRALRLAKEASDRSAAEEAARAKAAAKASRKH